MKNKILISICLLAFSTLCFAQQSKPVAELPAKGALMQTTTNEHVLSGDASTVTEGKKGLNAVNVKQAKQAGIQTEVGRTIRTNGQDDGNPVPYKNASAKVTKYACMNPSLADSTSNTLQTKHAINTKGTGATRNK